MTNQDEIIERLDRIEKAVQQSKNPWIYKILPWLSISIALLSLSLNSSLNSYDRGTLAIVSWIVLFVSLIYLMVEIGKDSKELARWVASKILKKG